MSTEHGQNEETQAPEQGKEARTDDSTASEGNSTVPGAGVVSEPAETIPMGAAEAAAAEPAPQPVKPTVPPLKSLTATEQLDLRRTWESVRNSYRRRLVAEGKKPAGAGRYIKGAHEFIDWCVMR